MANKPRLTIAAKYPSMQIDAAALRGNVDFERWINTAAGYVADGPCAATWHRPQLDAGRLTDYSDVFIWKDKGREGSDSDMPKAVWNALCDLAGDDFAGILWLTF